MDKQQRRDKNPHKTKHIQKRNDTARIPGAAVENTLEKCDPAGENDSANVAATDSTFDQYEPASKIEDAAMKTAAQFLGEELPPYLKVTGSSIFNKPVTTYVLISGKVKQPMSSLTEGVNDYHIVAITMQEDNADEWMEKIDRSMADGGLPTAKELLPLILLPLMSGSSSLRERISYAFRVLQKVEKKNGRSEKLDKMHAILYALAYKFLKVDEFQLIKEEISMTELGQMLVDDGIKIGEMRGKRDGIAALIETCQELGLSREETAQKVMLRFDYTRKKAMAEVRRCWK